MSNSNTKTPNNNNTKAHSKHSKSTKSVRKTVEAMDKPFNNLIECMLTVPEHVDSVNPQGLPQNVGVIRHSKVSTLREGGNFQLHPTLSSNMLTAEVEESETSVTAATNFVVSGEGGGQPRAFSPQSGVTGPVIPVTKYDLDLPKGGSFLVAPAVANDAAAPYKAVGSTHGYPINLTSESNLVMDFEGRLANVASSSATLDVNFAFILQSGATSESYPITIANLQDISTSLASSGVVPAGTIGVRVSFDSGQALSFENFRLKFRFSEVSTFSSGVLSLGLTDQDTSDIEGIVSSGRVSLLGFAAWLQWSGTMQQGGTLKSVASPIESTAELTMSEERIISLQKSRRTSYQGELPKGVIMFGAPLNDASYGKMQKLGSFDKDWVSHFGHYSAVTTAAGSDLPRVNFRLVVVLGYYPDNVLVKPATCVYSPFARMSAQQFMSEFPIVYENDSHKKTIKKYLEKTAAVIGKGIRAGMIVADIAKAASVAFV